MMTSKNIVVKNFLISLVFFIGICLFYYINTLNKTEGHFTYLLDDTYIHLSIAKNFALHHVWGITPYEFSSTSSSPLFTFIISALIKVFGNNDQIPLYFNLFFGIVVVYFLAQYYSELFKNTRNTVFAVIFTLFFAVMHVQLLSGMEHLFHVFLFIVNIKCFYQRNENRLSAIGFYITLSLMGLVRFESMFYFAILIFVFLLVKKWRDALGVLLAGFIPVILFCYFNYQQDGYFFPNSVIVKGTKLNLDSGFFSQLTSVVGDNLLLNASFYKIGIFPILISLIFLYRSFQKNSFRRAIQNNFFLIALSLLMICHALFADLKGAFRYEAYILTGFAMVIIPKVKDFFENFKSYIRQERLITLCIAMNILLLLYKSLAAHLILDNGGKNIYEQQVQSAMFLHTYYNTSNVVANDIGAITYFTQIHLLDIVGLGSKEMIPFNMDKRPIGQDFEDFLSQYSADHHYEIAVVYEDWFQGHIPKTWTKAGVLKINNRVTASRDEVSIYSVNNTNLTALKENIRNFKWNKNVRVKIIE